MSWLGNAPNMNIFFVTVGMLCFNTSLQNKQHFLWVGSLQLVLRVLRENLGWEAVGALLWGGAFTGLISFVRFHVGVPWSVFPRVFSSCAVSRGRFPGLVTVAPSP